MRACVTKPLPHGLAGRRAARRAASLWIASLWAALTALGCAPALGQPAGSSGGSATGAAPTTAAGQNGQTPDQGANAEPTAAPAVEAPRLFAAGPFVAHAQATVVEQANDAFRAPFSGPNSLWPHANGRETADITLYAGLRLWSGGELWVDPEVDQGFGLTGTLGAAGFPSGEAYKVGSKDPYVRVQRVFIRQTIDLGGASQGVDADLNQLEGTTTADRLVITVGKISVADIFDANKYAHDPRGDFMNWTVIDAGTFDYAADSWGYAAGAVIEWIKGRVTLRGGAFLLSDVPNSPNIDTRFDQFQAVSEAEERHTLFGRSGVVRLTGYLSRGRMARLLDAVALADRQGGAPDAARVRRYAGRPGVSIDIEQELAKDLGAFLRAGVADGRFEAYEFTDVDRSASAGLSLGGARWGRPDDVAGLAAVINIASKDRRLYLADGGLGLLVGDGRLPRSGPESILEGHYEVRLTRLLRLGLDAQSIVNPGYDRERGPVAILGMRLHVQL